MPYIDSDDDSNELIKPGGFMNLFMINLKTIVIDSNDNEKYNRNQIGYICFKTKHLLIFYSWNELEKNIGYSDYRNDIIFYTNDSKKLKNLISLNKNYFEFNVNHNFQDKCYTRKIKELSGGKRKR